MQTRRPDANDPRTADMDVVAVPDADPMLASAAVGDIGDAEAATAALDSC